MFKLLAAQSGMFAVQDTEDESIEAVFEHELKYLLQVGVSIEGASLNDSGELSWECVREPEIEDDDEDDFEEDEYEDDFEEIEIDDEDDEDDYDSVDDDDEVPVVDEDYEDDWYDEYDDMETEYDSTVSKLYDLLTSEQRDLLKMYYLWYSRRLFSEAQKDPTFGMKDASRIQRKKENLDELKNTGGLWHYAGFVDMGYKGAGYCTLGHPLRFMHLAWDVSVSDVEAAFFGSRFNEDDYTMVDIIDSDYCIKFGIKCISDFFEVDNECVKALQSAQRESLKDMAILYKFYESGQAEEISNKFYIMDEIARQMNKGLLFDKNYMSYLDKNIISFYAKFRKLKMVPPKSMVQEIRDKLIGWEGHKFTGTIKYPERERFIDTLQNLVGERYIESIKMIVPYSSAYLSGSSVKDVIYAHLVDWLEYKICGEYEYDADVYKDEGGASKIARYMLSTFRSLPAKNLNDNREYSVKYAQSLIKLIAKSTELSELGDWALIPKVAIDRKGHHSVDEDTLEYNKSVLKEYSQALFEASELQRDIKNLYGKRYLLVKPVEETVAQISSAITLINNNKKDYIDYADRYLKNYVIQENKKLDKTEPDAVETESVVDDSPYWQELFNMNLDSIDGMEYEKKILSTVQKSGKLPSFKQEYYLKKLYKEATGNEVTRGDKDVSLVDRPDLENAIKYVLVNPDVVENIVVMICKSVLDYGKITPRQMKYVLDAKKAYDVKQ